MKVADKLREELKNSGDNTSEKITHIVCYSGGYSSGLVAANIVEYCKDHTLDEVIILNHDIHPDYEDADIKRFKEELATLLGLDITYANYEGITDPNKIPNQFEVCEALNGARFGGAAVCTSRLKTKPFEKYLKQNYPPPIEKIKLPHSKKPKYKIHPRKDVVIYYGFDKKEMKRVQRRSSALANMGYYSDYPLALWPKDDINKNLIEEGGVRRPMVYDTMRGTYNSSEVIVSEGGWSHANCIGCVKAGKQYWYSVYCIKPDVWDRAKIMEERLGGDKPILGRYSLEELEDDFEKLKEGGLLPNQEESHHSFWKRARAILKERAKELQEEESEKPCDCSF